MHEAHRAVDLTRDHLVSPSLAAARDELLIPRVDLVQIGEPPLGEGADQVEGRRRLVIRA